MINKLITAIILVSLSAFSYAEGTQTQKPRTKEVCKEVTKNGKTTKQCKTIKIHKKLEGRKVPEKNGNR